MKTEINGKCDKQFELIYQEFGKTLQSVVK